MRDLLLAYYMLLHYLCIGFITQNTQLKDLSLYQFVFGEYYEKEDIWIRFLHYRLKKHPKNSFSLCKME